MQKLLDLIEETSVNKLICPIGFEEKFVGWTVEKKIPTYFEIVKFENGFAYPTDLRAQEYLVEKLGFGFLGDSKVNFYSESRLEQAVFQEVIIDVKKVSVVTEENKHSHYCKICGRGLLVIDKNHVEEEHHESWEEYQRLPVMIPDDGFRIYWASDELQEAFPEPTNLLCDCGIWANYLDFLKLEGVKCYKEIADYYKVPFVQKKVSSLSERLDISVIFEYCKLCGIQIETSDKLDEHLVSHRINAKQYSSLTRNVPDICMAKYWKHGDLQRAFPEPLNMNKGFGPFCNFLDWCKTDGVRKHSDIRKFFQGK